MYNKFRLWIVFVLLAFIYGYVLLAPKTWQPDYFVYLRELAWTNRPIIAVVTHVVLGFCIFFMFPLQPVKRQFLVPIIPVLGFLALFILEIIDPSAESKEGIFMGLSAFFIAAISMYFGSLIGFVFMKVISAKSTSRGHPLADLPQGGAMKRANGVEDR